MRDASREFTPVKRKLRLSPFLVARETCMQSDTDTEERHLERIALSCRGGRTNAIQESTMTARSRTSVWVILLKSTHPPCTVRLRWDAATTRARLRKYATMFAVTKDEGRDPVLSRWYERCQKCLLSWKFFNKVRESDVTHLSAPSVVARWAAEVRHRELLRNCLRIAPRREMHPSATASLRPAVTSVRR